MAKYCVYCYNGIHKTYYRKSKDFILTKDYHKCEVCGRQRRLVIISLFQHIDWTRIVCLHPGVRDGVELSNDLFFYIPLNIVVRSYRLIKKLYKKLTQKNTK